MAEGVPIGALAVRIGADATDLIKGFKQAEKAGDDFASNMKSVATRAAGMATAVASAGAALFAFAKSAANALDELGKLSQKVGVSVESLSALKYAAELSDVSIEQLSTGLRQLSKNMLEAQAGTGDARQAFKALGLEVTDSSGALVGTEEQLLRLAEKFAGMNDGAGKTALAMKIFGKSGAELIPLLNQGRAGIEQLRIEAEKLGVIFSTEAAKKAEEFNDNVKRLEIAARGLRIELAGPFVTAFANAADAMVKARLAGEGFFKMLGEGIRGYKSGTDADVINKQIVEATDEFMKAQNELDRVRNAASGPNAGTIPEAERLKIIEKYEQAVVRAKEKLEKLVAIKPIMAPETPEAKKGGKDAPTLVGPDDEALKAARDAYLKAFEMEEEARALGREFEANERKRELEEAQAHYELMLKLREEAIAEELRMELELAQIMDDYRRKERENEEKQQKARMKNAASFLENLASLTNTNSKKMFEVGKAAAIAQASVKTGLAVIDAWEAGMSTGGPWAPFIAAAYAAAALAAGANYINNLRSQSFGGGGGAPTPAGQGVSGVASAGAMPGGNVEKSKPQRDITINLHGSRFSRNDVLDMLKGMDEVFGEGASLKVNALPG